VDTGTELDSNSDLEQLLRDYGFRRTQRRLWDEAADRWRVLSIHQRDYKRQCLRLNWLSVHLSGVALDQIDDDVVIDLAEKKRKETSASTSNRYMALLRVILRSARDDWHWLHWIPRIRFYPEPEHRVRWLRPYEARRLISELPDHLRDLAIFTLATGLRQSNATGLTWDRVDMDRRVAWVTGTDSKSKRAFSVPLNDTALRILSWRRSRHPTHVFEYKGKIITRCSNSAWNKAKLRAGIDDFRWHDLRHTWASWHVQSGTSLYELQELGGWKTLEMVLRYAHLCGDQLQVAALRIEGNLGEVLDNY
jgi:integrase